MPATITGIVFNDLNHNGQFDPGEPGIPNVSVVLFSAAGGTCVTAQTDANGNYSFTVTAAGSYTVYEPVANPGAVCPPSTFTQPAGFTMSNGPRKLTLTVTAGQIAGNAILANTNFSHDTVNNPLFCSTTMIQFSGRPTVWFNINVVTGQADVQGTVNPPLEINAIGYNTLDNYIYGYDQLNNHIVRVDSSGNVIVLAPLPTGLPADGYNVGTFDLNGFLYIAVNSASRFYVIDLRPNSATFLKLVNPANGFQEQTSNFGVALSRALNASDWVYRTQDNNLYSITPTGVMQRVVPASGAVTSLTTTPLRTGPFGAVSLDSTGTIFAISNSDGNIYKYTINGNAATNAIFSHTVTTSFNDATMCQLATVIVDFGDAPDTGPGNGPNNYSTLLENDGPRHSLVNALFLGTQVTGETDALQNPTATGDDIPRGIQDDGLTVPLPPVVIGVPVYTLQVTVTNQTGRAANLYGWVDFNADGVFQTEEAAPVQVIPSQAGTQLVPLTFTLPPGLSVPPDLATFVRLRLTTDTLVNQTPIVTAEDTRSLGPASDGEVEDYIVEIVPPASIVLAKTASPAAAAPGETVVYTFKVVNPNPFDLTNVRIEDSLLGLIDILSVLPAGAAFDIQATFEVPPGTPAGTVIVNTVTATTDQTPPVSDQADVTVLPAFSLAVTKTPDRLSAAPGETVTYTLTVTNTSNAPITNVNVKDDLVGFSETIPTLAAGESRSFQVPFVIPPGTLAGTVFTNLTTAIANETEPASDTAVIVVTPVPDIFLTKNVDPQIASPGETVTYTITATNAGNQTLTNVHIVDPKLGIDQTFNGLKPNDTIILTVPFTIPPTALQGETLINVATVTTNETGPSQADAVVTVFGAPDIALDKTVDPTEASPGDTVAYSFVVTNTGNTVLTNVRIADPLLGLNETIGSLAAGESRTVTFPFVVPQLDASPFVNIATAFGQFESQTVQDSADASLDVIIFVPVPELSLTKSVDKPQANPGDTVQFTFTVTNTGNVALTDVLVSDPLLNFLSTIPALDVGAIVTETLPFVIPADAIPGTFFTNVVAVVTAETDPQQAEATVVSNGVPAIALTKTADRANAQPGDTITYTITVSNTGNVTLTNVTVRDALLGLDTVLASLDPGQSQVFTPTFTVPAGVPDGTVIVNRSVAFADQTDTVETEANVLVDPLPPAMTVAKTSDRAVAAPGDTVLYTVTVANPGTIALTNVVLTDDTIGVTQQVGTLDPGASESFTFPFIVPADAPNGSVIVNTVVATSDQTNPVEDSAAVTVDPSPGLAVTKSISPAQAAPGQTVTFSFEVRNTGNVALTNVVITDAMLGFSSVIPSLAAGASTVVQHAFVTPEAPAGTVLTNIVTAESTETGPVSDDAALEVLPVFALSLTKRVEPASALAGETVTFFFEIRNTSNAPLTNLRFTDDLLGIDKTIDLIPAGLFVLLSRTFTVPEGTRGGTVIVNTAVLGADETGTVTAEAQVTVPEHPELTIRKTVFPTVAIPGEVVLFRAEGVNTGNVPLTNIRYADPQLGLIGNVARQDVGESLALIIPFTIPAGATPGETIVNTVLVNSAQTGPLSASAAVQVAGFPLVVTKRAEDELVFVGDTFSFIITVANRSTVAANRIVLSDVLQAGTRFVPNSVTVGGKAVPGADPAAGIPLGNLAPDQYVDVVFQAEQTVTPPHGTLHNQATASFQPANSLQRFTALSNLLVLPVENHEE